MVSFSMARLLHCSAEVVSLVNVVVTVGAMLAWDGDDGRDVVGVSVLTRASLDEAWSSTT